MKNTFIILILFSVIAALLLNSCSGDSPKPIRVGDPVASFTAVDLKNRTFTLAAHQGKPVIIRFFLIDCPYCKADTPVFNEFYRKYGDQGLEIVYLNNNGKSESEIRDFAHELEIDFPVIYDPEGIIARQYHVRVQPLTLVLSPEHKLLAALLGGVGKAELDELLAPYLQD